MFKIRYWREYPWWLQLFQLVMMIFIFTALASAVAYVFIPKMAGVSFSEIGSVTEISPKAMRDAVLLFQFVSSACLFLIPSLLFAYAMHPKPAEFLGLRKPGKSIQWLLVVIVILSAMTIFLAIPNLLKDIDFGPKASELQEQTERQMKALLKMDSFVDFLKVFIVLAVLPAIGEELLFRGIVMRFAAKRFRNNVMPISISAIMFALLHGNVYGFISILLAGALLGIIYYLTGSLWCSILAHMINNGLQVVLLFAAQKGTALYQAIEREELPMAIPVVGIVVFAISFYLLWKNRTPLPPSWSQDFTADEIANAGNN